MNTSPSHLCIVISRRKQAGRAEGEFIKHGAQDDKSESLFIGVPSRGSALDGDQSPDAGPEPHSVHSDGLCNT